MAFTMKPGWVHCVFEQQATHLSSIAMCNSQPPFNLPAGVASSQSSVRETHRRRKSPLYEKWITQLFAPGSSLGGARPKASARDEAGTLCIAKFPSRND